MTNTEQAIHRRTVEQMCKANPWANPKRDIAPHEPKPTKYRKATRNRSCPECGFVAINDSEKECPRCGIEV